MKQFGIFAKHWTPGTVKTRLAAKTGAARAADFHRASVATLLSRFEAMGDSRVVCHWPPHQSEAFSELAGQAWQVTQQIDGDLGQRMLNYFDEGFTAGYRSIVLIGSDSPTVPMDFIVQAFESLDDHDVVLGPSEDGGYYLVGCSQPVPELFANIRWSSPDVWQQSVERLTQGSIAWLELPPWYDVDEYDDLLRLQEDLKGPKFQDAVWDELRRA